MCIFHKWVYSGETEIEKNGIVKDIFLIRKCHKCGKTQKNIGYFYRDTWALGGGACWTDKWMTTDYDSQSTGKVNHG